MAAPDPALERPPLLWSIAVTSVLGVLGVVWGLAVESQMIVLDGAYAIVGVVLSVLLLAASRLAAQDPTGPYPFGREGVTPLVIGIQGFVLLATLGYAGVSAVGDLIEGGSAISPGWATAYGVITAASSLAFWVWIAKQVPGSDLIEAESKAWRIGALRGVGMVIGFATMWVLHVQGYDTAARYVDPVMVLITCVVFAPTPLAMVRGTFVELLEGEPDDSIRTPVVSEVEQLCRSYGFTDAEVRLSKVGPKLYVEVEAFAAPDYVIGRQFDAREELRGRLDALPFDLWVNFELIPNDRPR